MRLKSELYKKEQEEIIDKICNILGESNQALKPSCYKQTLQGYEKTQP